MYALKLPPGTGSQLTVMSPGLSRDRMITTEPSGLRTNSSGRLLLTL